MTVLGSAVLGNWRYGDIYIIYSYSSYTQFILSSSAHAPCIRLHQISAVTPDLRNYIHTPTTSK